MDSDQMKIDPDVLERIIVLIENYASKQKDVLTKLTTSMRKVSDEWEDEKTFGEMLKYLEMVDKRSSEMFEQMRIVYKKYYYDEVLDIRKNLNSLKV